MKAHDAEADRALAHRRIAGIRHAVRRHGDEMRQHIVKEAHHILDQAGFIRPFVPGLDVH